MWKTKRCGEASGKSEREAARAQCFCVAVTEGAREREREPKYYLSGRDFNNIVLQNAVIFSWASLVNPLLFRCCLATQQRLSNYIFGYLKQKSEVSGDTWSCCGESVSWYNIFIYLELCFRPLGECKSNIHCCVSSVFVFTESGEKLCGSWAAEFSIASTSYSLTVFPRKEECSEFFTATLLVNCWLRLEMRWTRVLTMIQKGCRS